MAAVVGDCVGLVIQRAPDFSNGAESNNFKTFHGTLYLINAVAGVNTQVAGGTDTLDINISTAILAQTRNGKTPTVRGIPQVNQPLQNAVNSFSGTTTVSTNTVSITPKTSDWSTNATITAVAAVRPYGLAVTWTEA